MQHYGKYWYASDDQVTVFGARQTVKTAFMKICALYLLLSNHFLWVKMELDGLEII